MDINQNYREAVKSIKEAILRSQYRAAASVNKEQLSLYYGIGRYVSENSRTGFWSEISWNCMKGKYALKVPRTKEVLSISAY